MNREACCLQLGQLTGANWNHPLASGFTRERRLLHPATALRHSTSELLTELKLNLDLEKKKGIGNPMYFNRRVFLHTAPSSLKCLSRTRQQNARDYRKSKLDNKWQRICFRHAWYSEHPSNVVQTYHIKTRYTQRYASNEVSKTFHYWVCVYRTWNPQQRLIELYWQ